MIKHPDLHIDSTNVYAHVVGPQIVVRVLQPVVQNADPDPLAGVAHLEHGQDVQVDVRQVGAHPGVSLRKKRKVFNIAYQSPERVLSL